MTARRTPARAAKAETVTMALLQLVANAGNVTATAKEVGVAESTLRAWKNDTHAEQYRRLEEQHGRELELQAIDQARQRIIRAGEVQDQLLDEMLTARDKPQALRAAADVYAKSVDRLLSMTGRPVQPKDPSGGDMIDLVKHMIDKGYVRLAAGVQIDSPPDPKPK